MKNLTVFFSFFLLLCSCAKTDEQLIDSARQEAKRLLTVGKCDEAKKALDEVGYQSDDAVYISLYASTYGCKAGYSELDLFSDISTIQSPDDALLGSLTQLSTSNETQADSDNYKNIMLAIDTLLNAGATGQPSAVDRESFFGPRGGTDLSFQALYLILVELGKFMKYYGNADGGIKGAGTSGNTCLFSYSHADQSAYVSSSGLTASCNSATGVEGSADLPAPATDPDTLRRLCEGFYLFNNLRDILANVSVGSNGNFGALDEISLLLEAGISDLAQEETNNLGTNYINDMKGVTSKKECETFSTVELESWYAFVFETLFQ